MPASDEPTCNKWMPRAKTYCARGADHAPPCATPERVADWRQRSAERRPDRVVTPEAKARWNRSHKFTRLGISEERFNAVLEAQGHACAMCREPFGDDFPHADHDHNCHEGQPKARAKACEKCFRGLLCMRCNTALGYIEKYGELAQAYLARVAA